MRIAAALCALALLAPRAHAGNDALAREVASYLEELAAERPVLAAAGGSAKWTVDLALYAWAAGVEGDIGARGITVPVDLGFDEIFDALDGAFMLHATARKGRWGVALDVFRIGLEFDATGPLGVPASLETELFIGEAAVRYTVLDRPVDETRLVLDVYAGARVYSADTEVTVGTGVAERSGTWVDPIVGLDAVAREGKWGFGARADVGGFGAGSDLSWSALVGVRYHFTEAFSMGAGCRWLDIDYANGSGADAFTFDARLAGPFLAFVVSF